MPYPIDDATANDLISLHPWTAERSKEPVQLAVQTLVEAERARRGQPDKLGAVQALALTQGTLLKEEYDLSTHAHHDGWRVGAVIVDVNQMMLVNMRLGFAAGDAVLKAVVASLVAQYPGARVVRIHADAFAALLVPSSQREVREDDREATRARLTEDVRRALPEGAPAENAPGFTVSLLELTVEQPSHWQVLGPLVWAELERALTLEKMGQASGLQRRRIRLDGFVPPDASR